MTTPSTVPYLRSSTPPERWTLVGGVAFQVSNPGWAGGMELWRGDQLLTWGKPADGHVGVVMPRGYGRPMLAEETSSGPRSLPSNVPCAPERWMFSGRVVLRTRQCNSLGYRRLPFAYPVAHRPNGLQSGRIALRLDLEGVEPDAVGRWLQHHLPVGSALESDRIVAACPWTTEDGALEAASLLVTDLWGELGVRAAAAVSSDTAAAFSALSLLGFGSVAAVLSGAEALLLQAIPSESERQLSLFPAPIPDEAIKLSA